MGMGAGGSLQTGITNLGNVAKGKGTTTQPTTTTPTTTPSTGQWYDNPNWSQPYNNATANRPQGYQTPYDNQNEYLNPYAMYNPIQPNYEFYRQQQNNAAPFMQQNYRSQMVQNPYASQNGYQPYYRPPAQNPYQGQFGGIK